ncbi:membrane protein [Betaproteobacteria bacterium]|nr:membrane protein [Betaproteobacteria bacterium]
MKNPERLLGVRLQRRQTFLAVTSVLALSAPAAVLAADIVIDPGSGYTGGNVYGNSDTPDGQGNLTSPEGNKLTVMDSTLMGSAWGAVTSSGGDATGNTVTLTNVDVSGGGVFGGRANATSGAATASENSVSITGGTVLFGSVSGGYANASGAVMASGNSVSITGGTVLLGSVYGGYVYSQNDTATTSNNRVTLTGVDVSGDVFGGYADSDGAGKSGDATNNMVVIDGGSIGGNIYGGFSRVDQVVETGTATGNTVTLTGAADLSASSSLYGGFVGDVDWSTGSLVPESGMDAFTGNTLNLKGWTGTVANVANFQTWNVALPATFAAGDTALTVTNTADIRGTTINVGIDGNQSALNKGDEFTLIDAGTLESNADTKVKGMQGVSLAYDFDFDVDASGKVISKVSNVGVDPQTKALSEGFLGGVAFSRQGADLVADQGMARALASARAGAGPQGFAAIAYGDSKYKTGSHVNVDGYSLLAGLSGASALSAGRLTLGAFLEAGDGNYDSHNSFANGPSVKGKGDTRYYGLGVLGRFDFDNSFYTEASLRAGRLENDFSGNLNNTRTRYDTRSSYTSFHAGLGYVWKTSDKATLDVYGKYLWTHVAGDSVRLNTGDPVKFDAVNSQRLRVGARFSNALSESASFYVGAAYEHEFDGQADAKTFGQKIKSPDLKGGTGIGEVGFTLRPSGKQNFSVDLGLQGYVGKREGVTGSVQAKYRF